MMLKLQAAQPVPIIQMARTDELPGCVELSEIDVPATPILSCDPEIDRAAENAQHQCKRKRT
jgi:hypothetical protein